MFDSLKTFFGKFKKQSEPTPASPPPPAAQPTKKAAAAPPPAKATAPAAKPAPAAAPRPAPVTAAAPPESTTGAPDETISLPLKPLLAKLPSTLSALVKSSGNGEVAVSLPKVLKQLPQGSVKITFGELRIAAPVGTFLEVASQDQTLVELPLPEILSRINPGLLTRRTPQKVLDAPAEVGNLFGNRGETLPQPAAPTSPASAAPRPAAPAAAPAKPSAPAAPIAPKPAAPAPVAPKPAAPIAAPGLPKPPTPALPKPAAPAPAPVAAPKPAAPIPAPSIPRPPAAPAPAPIPAPKIPLPTPAPTPAPAAPKMPEPIAAAPTAARGDSTQYFLNKESVAAGDTISIPLASLMENWPEPVKEEARKAGAEDATVAFPMAQLEVALKSGKIVFPWKQIAAWIKPNPPVATLLGETSVELPLKVIAPLFIQQHRPAKAQKKVSIGENIPDIFSGGAPVLKPAASAPAAAAPAAAPIPAPATPAAASAPSVPKPIPAPSIPKPAAAPIPAPSIPKPAAPAPVAAKEPATMGEVFGQPDKKDWAPNEVVQKTSALKGMSGAMIVTSDGLLVAGQVPAPYKADTIGAFLPQIFVRMNQYGKELQVGELNSLQVEFNKTPWYIVKLGHIYFGAVGKAGEAFPTSLLKVIASELEKPTR